ncbi:MAG: NifB/NifX family molybdenum-iron cluster-binding protein [Candidatus Aquicultor sp.]
MKIAVSTADEVSVCGHLGHVSKFFIYEVEGATIVSRQIREVTPVHGPNDQHEHHHGEGEHQHHSGHHAGHGGLVGSISDCTAVITNGMGGGMVHALQGAGIDPVMTLETNPDAAVLAYLNGTIAKTSGCGHCGH